MSINSAAAIDTKRQQPEILQGIAADAGRRSYTSPNEIEVEIDLEQRPREGSVDGVSERGELMSASFFDEEEGACGVGQQKWEDFMSLQQNEKRQPQLHEETKSLCMKIFPKLAQRTNLTPDELKTYYAIRFTYIIPYNEKVKVQEQNLLSLAMVLLRGGKVRFELHPEGEVDGMEESKLAISTSQIGIQFNHNENSVTID